MNIFSKNRIAIAILSAFVLVGSIVFYLMQPTSTVPSRSSLRAVAGAFKMNELNSSGILANLVIYLEGDSTGYTLRDAEINMTAVLDNVMDSPKKIEMLVQDTLTGPEIWQITMDGNLRRTYEETAKIRGGLDLTRVGSVGRFSAIVLGVAAFVVLAGVLYSGRSTGAASRDVRRT
jgi:hypothetical protein